MLFKRKERYVFTCLIVGFWHLTLQPLGPLHSVNSNGEITTVYPVCVKMFPENVVTVNLTCCYS